MRTETLPGQRTTICFLPNTHEGTHGVPRRLDVIEGDQQPIAIARTRAHARAGRAAPLTAAGKGPFELRGEAIVHAEELLARPAALLLVARLRSSAHEHASAAVEIPR